DQIGELTAIFEVVETAGRDRARRRFVRAGNEMDAGKQVDEEIAAKSLSIISEAAPAEETLGIERTFWRVAQEGVPVDRFLAGVGRNRIDPGAGGRVAIPIGVNAEDLAEFA